MNRSILRLARLKKVLGDRTISGPIDGATSSRMPPVTKDPSIIRANSSERWNVDQLFSIFDACCWLARGRSDQVRGTFERDQPPVHWRRTDPEGMGQKVLSPGLRS